MLDGAIAGTRQGAVRRRRKPGEDPRPCRRGRLGKLDLLIVQDLFLSETARLADIVLPALSAYEKDGTMTNTAGEIQLVRKGGDFMGPRSDFDILRILSHQLARHGVGQAIRLRTPEAAFDEIRRHVAGIRRLLGQPAHRSRRTVRAAGRPRTATRRATSRRERFSSADDTLFTSGSLTRYCNMIQSLREAEAQP